VGGCPGKSSIGRQERGQALGVDLWQVLRSNRACNTYALEHGSHDQDSAFLWPYRGWFHGVAGGESCSHRTWTES
jgi:hypothetical protein